MCRCLKCFSSFVHLKKNNAANFDIFNKNLGGRETLGYARAVPSVLAWSNFG